MNSFYTFCHYIHIYRFRVFGALKGCSPSFMVTSMGLVSVQGRLKKITIGFYFVCVVFIKILRVTLEINVLFPFHMSLFSSIFYVLAPVRNLRTPSLRWPSCQSVRRPTGHIMQEGRRRKSLRGGVRVSPICLQSALVRFGIREIK